MARELPFLIHKENEITCWRAETFWSKEPETIEYISDFKNHFNAVRPPLFLDIGANIGIYSLYAASLYPDMVIIAVEPDMVNYAELVRNIKLNKFTNVYPLHCAVGCSSGIGSFTSGALKVGESSGEFNLSEINPAEERRGSTESAPLICLTIDYLALIFHIDFIKIDTDGAEYDILFGVRAHIGCFTSMLIEMDTRNPRHYAVIEYLKKYNYTLRNRFNDMPNHSRIRRDKEEIGHIENFVFTKI